MNESRNETRKEQAGRKAATARAAVAGHFRAHKELYIGVVVTAVVTAVGSGYAFGRPEVVANPKIQQILSWMPQATIIQFVERSTPSKPVHLVGTQQYFDSVADAARKTGHSVAMISRNVNGHISNVGGDVFELVKTQTAPKAA